MNKLLRKGVISGIPGLSTNKTNGKIEITNS